MSSFRTDIWTPLCLWFAFLFSFGLVWLLVGHYLKKAIEARENSRENVREDRRKDGRMKQLRICLDQFTIIRSGRIRSIRYYAALAVFVLFFYWHFWFVSLFFTNSIKVNKVVVDDSLLIKNFDDVMRTDRVHCFIDGETELLLSQFSPPETVMGKIYSEKSDVVGNELAMFRGKHSKCILKMQLDNMVNINEKMFFTFLERTGISSNLENGSSRIASSSIPQIIELKAL